MFLCYPVCLGGPGGWAFGQAAEELSQQQQRTRELAHHLQLLEAQETQTRKAQARGGCAVSWGDRTGVIFVQKFEVEKINAAIVHVECFSGPWINKNSNGRQE